MNNPRLSPEQLAHFAEQGYVRIPAALPPAFVKRMQSALWAELKVQYGIIKDDPRTWRAEQGLLNKEIIDRTAGVGIGPRLVGAVNQILGAGTWRPFDNQCFRKD